MDQIADPHSGTSAMMMNEMNSAKFRRTWLLPKLDGLLQDLGSVRNSPLHMRIAKIATWIGIEGGGLRSVRFSTDSRENFESLQSVARFCERTSFNSIFHPDRWIDETALASLIKLSEDGTAGFEVSRRSEDSVLYGVNIDEHAEAWLQTTKLKSLLDAHLDNLESARNSVREYVHRQHDLEAELLDI